MDNVVIPALITSATSFIVAIVAAVVSSRAAKRVARLNDELANQRLILSDALEEQRSARDARRDYEYEARKRLYTECEPLVFEALELARGALQRVLSLARTARLDGIRPDGSGWLEESGYYYKSTIYLLLAPITSSKILQRRLTQIDLKLEPRLRGQYEFLKLLFRCFNDDHEISGMDPAREYDPDRADPGEPDRDRLLKEQTATYRRQGFYLGTLEVIAERLISQSAGVTRCKSFGEFSSELDNPDSGIHAMLPDFDEAFKGFHPARQPVLWRILVAQSLLHEALLKTAHWPDTGALEFSPLLSAHTAIDLSLYDWRSKTSMVPDDEVREPLEVARTYVAKKLELLDQQMSAFG